MRVAILGGGSQRRYFKPQSDTEVWCLNGMLFPWLDESEPARMFNVHPYNLLVKYGYPVVRDTNLAIVNKKMILYTADKWPKRTAEGVPLNTGLGNVQVFPRDKLSKMPRGDYHCGTFDWLVAFAVYLKVDEIDLHGIGLCLEGGEPISARACLEYWCGYAEGNGIKVTAKPDCDIFHFYHLVKSNLVYGYDETPIFEDRTVKRNGRAPYDLSQARSAAIRARQQ